MFRRAYLLQILSAFLLVSCAPEIATATPAQSLSDPGMTAPTPVATQALESESVVKTPASFVPIHLMGPAEIVPAPGSFTDDVESSGTSSEKRAPYGDSLKLNRFERPFLADMTYIPDVDIHKFGLSEDADWFYISIQLIGSDPNNSTGINYGVEIDQNADGYGDYIIWANPPYSSAWDTGIVQVFIDTNQDSGGLSVTQSEDVFEGDGYDTLIFDGGAGGNDDPDLAWVRLNGGEKATIQFAFKKSFAPDSFMYGVVADAALKDVSKFDYSDRFTNAEAGSPIRGKENYPLGLLFAVDNTCWDAYGFEESGYEPKICQEFQPVIEPLNTEQPSSCSPPPNCDGNGGGAYDPVTCGCL